MDTSNQQGQAGGQPQHVEAEPWRGIEGGAAARQLEALFGPGAADQRQESAGGYEFDAELVHPVDRAILDGAPLSTEDEPAELDHHAVAEFGEDGAAAVQQLVDDFPELADEQHAQALVTQAREVAEEMGAPELASDPLFWRMVQQARTGHQVSPERVAERQAEEQQLRQMHRSEVIADQIVRGQTVAGSTDGMADGNLGRRALPF